VIAVDGTAALAEIARSRYPDLDVRVHDLTVGLLADLPVFDRVVAHMVLMDLPDLDPLLAGVAARLRPDAVFVLSILHPSFFGSEVVRDPATGRHHRCVTAYLEHEQRWVDSFGGHVHYHRPLSWYVERLTAHGLVVTRLHEPATLPQHTRPTAQWTPHERWFATIPTMLATACRPGATHAGWFLLWGQQREDSSN
jgi:SAM-dependent methyltransferase